MTLPQKEEAFDNCYEYEYCENRGKACKHCGRNYDNFNIADNFVMKPILPERYGPHIPTVKERSK